MKDGKRIGYIRVSTREQDTARQDAKINLETCDRVYTEKVSGKNADRPELRKMMEYVREGDTVIVDSYSRFSRNTKDLLELVGELDKKGVAFVSLKENVDTTTPQGRLIFTIFAGLAQFEREQTLERQAEGIAEKKREDAERKAQGQEPLYYKGRQPISIDEAIFTIECKRWRAGEQTALATMEKLHLKPNTFYRRVKELGL